LGAALLGRQLGGGVEGEFLLAGAGGRHECLGLEKSRCGGGECRRRTDGLPRYFRHVCAMSSNRSVNTSQFGSILDAKNDVITPFRNGASDAYWTMSFLSRAAQAAVVLAEKACDGGRWPRRSISAFVSLKSTFELLLLCCWWMFLPFSRTSNQSVGYG